MASRQQRILFLTNFILYFTGNGLFPLLPLFARGFGVSQTTTGIFLASLSATNALGAVVAGSLLARFPARTLLVAVSLLGIPGLVVLTQAQTFWVAVVAAGSLWFVGGFIGALLSVLTGLAVSQEARGRAFSLLFLASPVAAVLAGGSIGPLVSLHGYTTAFILLAVLWAVIPSIGLLLAPAATGEPAPASPAKLRRAPLSRSFYLLLISGPTVMIALQMRHVAAFLQMQAAGFSAAAVSSTTVVAGLVAIPVALYAGTLSDRLGRRTMILLGYGLVVLTAVLLAGASQLWHFSAGIALLLVAITVLRPTLAALATDLLPAAALQHGLPLLEAGLVAVGVVGSAGAGYLLEAFGPVAVSTVAVGLVLVGGSALPLLCVPRVPGEACPAPAVRLAAEIGPS